MRNRYYSSQKYPPRDPSSVELLSHKPAREFEVIADFQSRGESASSVRKKAAKIGADAVIISVLGGLYDRTDEWAGHDSMKGWQTDEWGHINGTAIKYKGATTTTLSHSTKP